MYNTPVAKGSVNLLQINPNDATAKNLIGLLNQRIETLNRGQGWDPLRGKFTTQLQGQYKVAADMRQKYATMTTEEKPQAKESYKTLISDIKRYCNEMHRPDYWAFASDDPGVVLAHNEFKNTALRHEAHARAGRLPTNNADPPTNHAGGPSTTSVGDPPTNHAGGPSTTSVGDPPTNNAGGPPTANVGGPAVNNTAGDLMEIERNTPVEPGVLVKRKIGRSYQFLIQRLIQERPEVYERMWASDREIDVDQDPESIPDIHKPTEGEIMERRYKYRGIDWVALAEESAVTIGAGQWPPVAVCVKWSDTKNTQIMWRSDAIRISTRNRVDRDVMEHLFRQYRNVQGREVCIMAATRPALAAGYQKAWHNVVSQDAKVLKSQLALPERPELERVYEPPAKPAGLITNGVHPANRLDITHQPHSQPVANQSYSQPQNPTVSYGLLSNQIAMANQAYPQNPTISYGLPTNQIALANQAYPQTQNQYGPSYSTPHGPSNLPPVSGQSGGLVGNQQTAEVISAEMIHKLIASIDKLCIIQEAGPQYIGNRQPFSQAAQHQSATSANPGDSMVQPSATPHQQPTSHTANQPQGVSYPPLGNQQYQPSVTSDNQLV